MKNLENLFNPKSIAIVGASEEEGKVGTAITKNILELGYAGQTFLVNTKHETLFGRKCYKSLNEIESAVDLAIIVIPAQFVNQVIKEAANKDKNYVVISAGFAETGEEGKAREEELKNIAAENNLNILGPNCLGFIIPSLKLNASFAPGMPEAGNIALVSQSGALIAATFDLAKKSGLKFSGVFSIGNKMDVSETNLLAYLEKDAKTKVIAFYLEGIKNGQEFIRTCQQIKKPIIVLKAGKNEKSQKAISSHTGALAGNAEIMSAVFNKASVIEAQNLEEFVNLANYISLSIAPENNSVAVITNAGGPGVLITDAFDKKSVALAELDDKIKTGLSKFLPAESSVENPVDLLGDADQGRYQKTLKLLDKAENIKTIVCILTPQEQTPVAKIAGVIARFKNKTQKNIIAVFIGSDKVVKSVKKLNESGIANFTFPEQAVDALEKYYLWKKTKAAVKPVEFKANENRKNSADQIIKQAKSENKTALSFAQSKKIMDLYQIPTVEAWAENELAAVKYPVAVKVDSDKVLHKTDQKALILNIKDEAGLKKAIAEIRVNFPTENLIIQPMISRQTELILGIKRDPVFGPVILAGLGGIYTEIFKIADLVVPVAGAEEIKNILNQGKLGFLFRETRGQKPLSIGEVAAIIENLQQLALENGEIAELDINPLLIYNDNKAAMAVDVKILV